MEGEAAPTKTAEEKGTVPVMPVLNFLLFLTFLLSLNLGRYHVPFSQILSAFGTRFFGLPVRCPPTVDSVLFSIRLPRILTAVLVGGALSSSGAAYQGLFRNPMVSPDLLGASAGAGFGAAIAILLSWGTVAVQVSSFIFGLLAVFLTCLFSRAIGKSGGVLLVLVLTGMVVETLFSSLISITKYVADPDSKLPEITFWLMGSLSKVLGMPDVLKLLIPVALGFVPLLLFRWKLNVLSFGEEEARALGVDTKKVGFAVIFSSTLLTAAAVSAGGMVGWVGLVVPHMARMIVGPDYRKLMPVSMLTGGIFLLLTDDIARSALPVEIPLGILTALVGAPFFLILMLKGKKGWI